MLGWVTFCVVYSGGSRGEMATMLPVLYSFFARLTAWEQEMLFERSTSVYDTFDCLSATDVVVGSMSTMSEAVAALPSNVKVGHLHLIYKSDACFVAPNFHRGFSREEHDTPPINHVDAYCKLRSIHHKMGLQIVICHTHQMGMYWVGPEVGSPVSGRCLGYTKVN